MPQDLLQIALEHHRAGRLVQAEAGYQSVLDANPDDADAMHWLGVLRYQAGQLPEAIGLLERATALRPDDPAYQHNLGQAYQSAGQTDRAIEALARAVAIDPAVTAPLLALALARLSRKQPGDAEAAVSDLKKAHAAGIDTADIHHQLGIALLSCGRAGEAVEACKTALTKSANDPMILFHLALAYRKGGQVKETRKSLIKALELEPALAQGWFALAMLDAEAGKFTDAAGLFRRAISADRNYADAYQGLANVLTAAGKNDEALAAFAQAELARQGKSPDRPAAPSTVADLERHLTPTPVQAHAHFAMAALMNVFPPTQSPNDTVAGLFDRYASHFDKHLVGALEYHTPELLAAAIASQWNGKPLDILDMGCGTGLCGPLLRPMAGTLAGVDISAGMIDKARERGVYDRLEVADLVDVLRKSPRAYDLLVCADVLIYVGDMSPTLEAATRALRPGGLLAFSVEAGAGSRYDLVQRSRRFAHSKPYVQYIASIYGFEETHFAEVQLRKENDHPVTGYLIVLRLPVEANS